MVTPPHNAGPEGAGEPDSGQPNAGQPNPGPAKSGQRNTGAENARLEQIKRSWQQKRQITDRLADVQTKIGIMVTTLRRQFQALRHLQGFMQDGPFHKLFIVTPYLKRLDMNP